MEVFRRCYAGGCDLRKEKKRKRKKEGKGEKRREEKKEEEEGQKMYDNTLAYLSPKNLIEKSSEVRV